METKLFNIPSLDKISYENDILSIVLDFGTIKKEKIVANCIFFLNYRRELRSKNIR